MKYEKRMKILHVANMNTDSGVACFLMNYVRHLDNQELDMDFVCWDVRADNFHEEIKKIGGNVLIIRSYKKSLFAFIRDIKKIMKAKKYDIIHGHEAIMSIPFLYLAKKQRIKRRIAHSHSSAMPTKIKNYVVITCRKIFNILCTEYCACSELAGNYLFGKKAFQIKGRIIKNAIDLKKFVYFEDARISVRKSLGIENNFVVGHIGRFNTPKNHVFLIDVFSEILKKNQEAKLLLVGEGETKKEIEKKVKILDINDQVVFLGIRRDIHHILQALDVFVFPSIFEGLGIVLIEAQASGLKCYASEDTPQEADCGGRVEFISRNKPASYWADRILSQEYFDRNKGFQKAVEAGYDIVTEAKKLEQYYRKIGDKDV